MTASFKIAIAGLGTVGGGVVKALGQRRDELSRRAGVSKSFAQVAADLHVEQLPALTRRSRQTSARPELRVVAHGQIQVKVAGFNCFQLPPWHVRN